MSAPNSPWTNHHNNSKAFNLSKLIGQDLAFVKESFETAKKNMDNLIADIHKASTEFQRLQLLETSEFTVGDLQELKVTVGKLKSSIPFSLITPYCVDPPNPHINRRPRSTAKEILMHDNNMNMATEPPKFSENPPTEGYLLYTSLNNLCEDAVNCLWCFLFFPQNTVIKKSLLMYWAKAHRICSYETKLGFNEVTRDIIVRRLVRPVYKNDGMTLSGYWMHPFVRYTLWGCRELFVPPVGSQRKYSLSSLNEEDIIHTDPVELLTLKNLRILHLGKWQRTALPHIEVPEPDLFFKDMEELSDLRYISLRGVSMITEIPQFIMNLKHLQVLDLKACHNLEVIPPNINNLWRCLTHLDMSDCYFVDHMPAALAELRYLQVLKGFFVGENENSESCTLHDLTHFEYLRKLNIYTSVRWFPNVSQFATLQEFKALRNLTISWGGCSVLVSETRGGSEITTTSSSGGQMKRLLTLNQSSFRDTTTFQFELEKLDLQCVPEIVTRSWLKPSNFKKLKKLYIRGGKFHDLGGAVTMEEEEQWGVEKLVIKHLSKLKMDWSELKYLFPKLVCFEKIECPNVTFFPRDGLWMNPARPLPTQNNQYNNKNGNLQGMGSITSQNRQPLSKPTHFR